MVERRIVTSASAILVNARMAVGIACCLALGLLAAATLAACEWGSTPTGTPEPTPDEAISPTSSPADNPTQIPIPSPLPTPTPVQIPRASPLPTATPAQAFSPAPSPTATPALASSPTPSPTAIPDQTTMAGELRWSFETDSAVHSSPGISDGVAFIASEGGYLYALDVETGEEYWRYRVGVSGSSPEVNDGILYVGSWDGHIYALDVGTGELLWRFQTEGEVNSSPAVAGGVVYFGSNDGTVYALNALSGEMHWSYETEGTTLFSPSLSDGVVYVGSLEGGVYALNALNGELLWNSEKGALVTLSLLLGEEVLYTVSLDGSAYALSAATGSVLWNYQTDGFPGARSPLLVDRGAVHFLSSNHVYTLDASTGELSWSYPIDDWLISSAAIAGEGVLYVSGAIGGYTHALDASNGLRLHSYPVSSLAAPTVSDGLVYIGSEAGVYAFGALAAPPQDQPPWRFQTDGAVHLHPTVVEGVAYVVSSDSHVYALDASAGVQLWRSEVQGEIYTPPVIAGELLYVGTGGGRPGGSVFALNVATGEEAWQFEADSAVSSVPIVIDTVAYVSTDRGAVYALEALTGELLWEYRIDFYGERAHIPYIEVDGGVAYIGSFSYVGNRPGALIALDSSTGELAWRHETSPTSRVLTAAIAADALYAGASDGRVIRLQASSGDLLWQFEAPSSEGVERERFNALTVDDETVYAASQDGEIYALDAFSGDALWQYEAGGGVWIAPLVADGVLYVGSIPDRSNKLGYVHALDASTGELVWRYEVGDMDWFSFVTDADGKTYIGSQDGRVSVLDSSGGEALWSYGFGQLNPRLRDLAVDRGATHPVVVDGVVYVGSADGSVYGLDSAGSFVLRDSSSEPDPELTHPVGKLRWRTPFPVHELMSSNPTVAGGVVYITLNESSLHALDMFTGEAVWSFWAKDWITTAPVVVDGTVYAGSWDQYVYALDASTGELQWSYMTGGRVSDSLRVYEEVVYAGAEDHLYALNASTGELLWKAEVEVHVAYLPTIVDNMVLIGSLAGYLYAFDAVNGNLLWRFKADDESYGIAAGGGRVHYDVLSTPAASGGVVYIGTDSGYVNALDASSGELVWQFEVGSKVSGAPVFDAGLVYAASSLGGRLYALDASTGELVWQYKPGAGISSLAVSGGSVYVGTSSHVFVLDSLTGVPRWRRAGRTLAPPSGDGIVYVKSLVQSAGEYVGDVTAIDAESGEILWTYNADVGLGRQATVADGVLYVTPTENYYDRERGYTGYFLYVVTGPS